MDVQKSFESENLLLGKRVIQLRKEIGFTQKELGERSEINRTEISRIENGTKNLEFFTIIKLVEGLRIELVSLFDYEGKRPTIITNRKQNFKKRFDKEKKLLGNQILSLRKNKKLLQVDIDLDIGIPDSDISRIENGIGNIKFYSIFRIARALKVSVAELFDY